MKGLALISFLVFYIQFQGQNTYPIKEHYDKLHPAVYAEPSNFVYQWNTGNSESWRLLSFLNLYEATNDKAYLIKFINLTIKIQNARQDKLHPNNSAYPPKWTLDTDNDCGKNNNGIECTYFNSLLIYPMAKFVNMVIQNPGLYNTNLPLSIVLEEQMQPTSTILGYGDFALWLGARVEETILYMNIGYWDNAYGIKKTGKNNDDLPADINMQAPYGCALLYMGLTNTNFGYGNNRATFLYQAQIIASHIKGNININSCNASYHFPLLRTMANNNNSYFWYHRGWRLEKENCFLAPDKPSVVKYIELVEDVSHGAMDLWFVKACYEVQLAPCNTCTPYFTSTEMERFRNTFTKNIYYTNATGGHFHNTVNGLDNGFAGGEDCVPYCPTDFYWKEVTNWMPLYQFDGNSLPNVYDVLLQHTIGVISPTNTNPIVGGQGFLGLSEVIKAQWDKECVNLTLYNRKNIYDQDFNVKNTIVVAPQQVDDFNQLNANSFADPLITNNKFTIEPNVAVNMTAGKRIELLPGFETKTGAIFTASINNINCTNGFRIFSKDDIYDKSFDNLTSSINLDSLISSKVEVKEQSINNYSISIFPNPTAANINITQLNNFVGGNIEIINLMGQVIFTTTINSNQLSVNLSEYPKGIYLVKISSDKEQVIEKIVLE